MSIVIYGRGRVGRGLHSALKRVQIPVRLVSGHAASPRPLTDTDTVIIAVSDPAIADVARALAPHVSRKQVVLHCSGSLGLDPLLACKQEGAHVAIMHPLVSFVGEPEFAGTTFVIAGDKKAVSRAREVARVLGARPLTKDVHGPAYHAAAALVANGAAGLAYVGVKLLADRGFSKREAEHALGGLLQTVGHNIAKAGLPAALTGPVARGDAKTVKRHLEALKGEPKRAYLAIAPIIIACAKETGLSRVAAQAIQRALKAR